MKIRGIFMLITIAVVLFLSVTTIKAGLATQRCSRNSQCPPSLSCQFHICMDMCEYLYQEGRICTMKKHEPSFKCKPGYEFPRGSEDNFCLPVEWSCYVDDDDFDEIIKCNSPKWLCTKSDSDVTCEVIKTLTEY